MKNKYLAVIVLLFVLIISLLFAVNHLSEINKKILIDREQREESLKGSNEKLLEELEEKRLEVERLDKKVKEISQIQQLKKEREVALAKVVQAREVTGEIIAKVTGYNSVPEQTDNTPCIASGGYICGRSDVVACPTYLKLGSWVVIDGKSYECMDRTHTKYGSRFDIFCDKDFACPYRVTGTKKIFLSQK